MTDVIGGWFDSHCHLQGGYLEGDGDLAGSLERAAAAGVVGLVCVGTDATTSREALGVAEWASHAVAGSVPLVRATVGVHPHEASAGTDALRFVLADALVADQPPVAIGECGLDYHYLHSPREAQREVFAEQIALATEHDLALVIHTREAWDETFEILVAEGVPDRTIIHCFTGGPDEARRCLDLGAAISFSGIATFKTAPEIREAASLCPPDRILIETDSPFLAPVPHRGKANEPAWVGLVGEVLAGVRGVAPAEFAELTAANARRAFAL